MVKGFDRLAAKLKNLANPVGAEVYRVIKKSGQPIITDAQSVINSRTGNLRNSIGFIERSKRYQKVGIIGPRTYGSWKGRHAHLIAKGWERKRYDGGLTVVPGNDFMGKAFTKNKQQVEQMLVKGLQDILKKQINK